MCPQEPEDPNSKFLRDAVSNRDIPHLYINGFTLGAGNADMTIVLKNENDAATVVKMSYTVAKTLAKKLGGMVAAFEDSVGTTILTTDDVDRKAKESLQDEPEMISNEYD